MTPSDLLSPNTLVARTPDQVSGELEGKTVLLNIENGEYYNMNEVGSRIWALLETPMTVGALIDRLVAEFEIDRDTCKQDSLEFLEVLHHDKLLRIEPKA